MGSISFFNIRKNSVLFLKDIAAILDINFNAVNHWRKEGLIQFDMKMGNRGKGVSAEQIKLFKEKYITLKEVSTMLPHLTLQKINIELQENGIFSVSKSKGRYYLFSRENVCNYLSEK